MQKPEGLEHSVRHAEGAGFEAGAFVVAEGGVVVEDFAGAEVFGAGVCVVGLAGGAVCANRMPPSINPAAQLKIDLVPIGIYLRIAFFRAAIASREARVSLGR